MLEAVEFVGALALGGLFILLVLAATGRFDGTRRR